MGLKDSKLLFLGLCTCIRYLNYLVGLEGLMYLMYHMYLIYLIYLIVLKGLMYLVYHMYLIYLMYHLKPLTKSVKTVKKWDFSLCTICVPHHVPQIPYMYLIHLIMYLMYLVSQYQKGASDGISRPSRPFSKKMASDGMRAGGPPDTQPSTAHNSSTKIVT